MGDDCICLRQRVRGDHVCQDSNVQQNNSVVAPINKKKPPEHPNYTPPKKGGNKKVKNPNGKGMGWPSKDGGVWVPDNDMHGGEGWTVQYPGGAHKHAYPGGHIREATRETNVAGGIILIFAGVVSTVWLVVNDATGIGVGDDGLIPATSGCIFAGIDQFKGKYTCDCGDVWYGN